MTQPDEQRVWLTFYVNADPSTPPRTAVFTIPAPYDYARVSWTDSTDPPETLIQQGKYFGISRPTSYPALPAYVERPPPSAASIDAAREWIADLIASRNERKD